jgi:hypothetical protein
MTHGMKDSHNRGHYFSTSAAVRRAVVAAYEAKRCPLEGCIQEIPALNPTWTEFNLRSTFFGAVLALDALDWIVFDMPDWSRSRVLRSLA